MSVDIGKNRRTQQKIIYYLLLKATSFDPAMGSSLGEEQKLEKLNVHGKLYVPYGIPFGLH
jgi:hypothetical protein